MIMMTKPESFAALINSSVAFFRHILRRKKVSARQQSISAAVTQGMNAPNALLNHVQIWSRTTVFLPPALMLTKKMNTPRALNSRNENSALVLLNDGESDPDMGTPALRPFPA